MSQNTVYNLHEPVDNYQHYEGCRGSHSLLEAEQDLPTNLEPNHSAFCKTRIICEVSFFQRVLANGILVPKAVIWYIYDLACVSYFFLNLLGVYRICAI